MLCLPTNRDGFLGAVAHATAARLLAHFDAGFHGRRAVLDHDPMVARRPPPTRASALAAVVARNAARSQS